MHRSLERTHTERRRTTARPDMELNSNDRRHGALKTVFSNRMVTVLPPTVGADLAAKSVDIRCLALV